MYVGDEKPIEGTAPYPRIYTRIDADARHGSIIISLEWPRITFINAEASANDPSYRHFAAHQGLCNSLSRTTEKNFPHPWDNKPSWNKLFLV